MVEALQVEEPAQINVTNQKATMGTRAFNNMSVSMSECE